MQEQHIIKWLILFLLILECVYSFEIFIKKTTNNNEQNIEQLGSFSNKSYQIPLFQTRYITIQINPNDLHHNVVGFKFQVKSSDIRVIDVQKEIMIPTNPNNILLEDLFIRKLINVFI
jgi:hypothetical protein